MALTSQELSVWEIGFRWNDRDPGRIWLRLPLKVKDSFRVLTDAILSAELPCSNLLLEKWSPDQEMPREFLIRTYMDDVYAAVWGTKFNRKLLNWASVDRTDFRIWCERRSIHLPEFWFPVGWTDYQYPQEESAEGEPLRSIEEGSSGGKTEELGGMRASQRARAAVQQIALSLWRETPEATIAALVKHSAIQVLGGGAYYSEEVVRRWISAIAPKSVKERRGRPKKERGTQSD